MDTIVRLESAAFSYGEQKIFSDISLSVSKGEVICILGANGCGKTTLLECLDGTLRLKRGKVYLHDNDISKLTPTEIARRMGFVFQEHSAPFAFTVIEVALLGRAPHLGLFSSPSARDHVIAERALDMVGMLHLKEKPYTQISGGERQLVLIARTLTQEPEIVLLDEPTSHLDFKNQTLILRMVNKMAEHGLTVIMTSHLPNHALQYSTKVALMNDGKFLAVGSPEEVMTEANLRDTYGIDVRILDTSDPISGKKLKYCIAG